jgi:hypothetical protein
MSNEQSLLQEPAIRQAVQELQALISARYPDAAFAVFERNDPNGIRLQATVDLEDIDEVMDAVVDALFDIQVEHGLPVYVVTEQPLQRVAERIGAEPRRASSAVLVP